MAVILITGSSTGIGFATAVMLAQSGHKVYASMRNPQNAPELQKLAEAEQLPIHIIVMDVNDDTSVKTAIESILNKEGVIDVLINNAGIALPGAVEELSITSFKHEMETNYFGTIRCIQAVLPGMRQRRAGCIINNTSIAGRYYGNFQSGYCASKAAVEAFSESLAQELQPHNIRVAVVEPGVVLTPIFLKSDIPESKNYPNAKRLFAFFQASLQRQTPPSVVAEVIRDIVDGKSSRFRNLAGPDALPLTTYRNSITDEEWISSVNIDDETYISSMEKIGLNVRPYMN